MSDEKSPKSIASLRTALAGEAVLILVFTGATYLTVYFYEVGYCNYFAIPLSLISPEVSTVLLFAFSTVIVGWAALNFAYLFLGLREFVARRKNPIIRRLIFTNGPLLAATVFLWMFTGHWGAFAGFVIGVLPMLILLVSRRATAEERLRQWDEETARTNLFPFTLIRRVQAKGMQWAVDVVIWSVLLEMSCFLLGGAAAKREREFLVSDLPEGAAVVLRIYGEKLICAQFDPNSKTCSKKFTILRLGEGERLFELKSVGPLASSTQ